MLCLLLWLTNINPEKLLIGSLRKNQLPLRTTSGNAYVRLSLKVCHWPCDRVEAMTLVLLESPPKCYPQSDPFLGIFRGPQILVV